MSLGSAPTTNPALIGDLVQPFKIEGQPARGRMVRLGPLLNAVLERHAYPGPVAALLTEMLTLAACLAASLKFDGVFTLQTKGDGPISLMVADFTSGGDARGYAQFDAARLAALVAASADGVPSVPRLMGAGYLAFTVDQGPDTERYQGIVELTGTTLVECLHHYFRQSEQFEAVIKLATAETSDGRRSGAIMLQRLPPEPGLLDEAEDGWHRSLSFLASCTSAELLDPGISPNDLLYRLFHEDGVRVFKPSTLRAGCRCSRVRVEQVLRSLPAEELESFRIDGQIYVICEFCSARYDFEDSEIAALHDGDRAGDSPQG
ncbi:MAG: Hsp33 family molecular chaperone HslO [Dongiaceae bacterium]